MELSFSGKVAFSLMISVETVVKKTFLLQAVEMGFSIFREMREQNRNLSLSKPCQYQNSILSSVIDSFNISIYKKKVFFF